jgi:osmotically-inducible protein OsmY
VIRSLAGVKGVTSLITLKPDVEPSDVKAQMERALVRNAELDAQRIKVAVQGSKVILSGTVRSYAEKVEAERAAWAAPGVTSVDNRLIVSPP